MPQPLQSPDTQNTPPAVPGWLVVTGILVAVIGLVIACLPFAFRTYMLRNWDPAARAKLEKLVSEPVNFPASWGQLPTISPEVTSAALEMGAEADRVGRLHNPMMSGTGEREFDNFIRGHAFTDEDFWTSMSLRKLDTAALVALTSTAVQISSWTCEAVGPMHYPGSYRYSIAANTTLQEAALLQRSGSHIEAFDYALNALAIWQGSPVGSQSGWQRKGVDRALSLLCTLAQNTTDAQLLRRTQARVAELQRRIVYTTSPADYPASLCMEELHALAREGCPVDLTPGKPAVYYLRQCIANMQSLSDKRHRELTPGDWRLGYYQSFPDYLGAEFPSFVSSKIMFNLSIKVSPEWFMADIEWYARDSSAAECIKRERYDLARLYMANRIRELDGRAIARNPSDFVPEFFVTEPRDPITSAPYMWSEANHCYYAVGPNGSDDKLSAHVGSQMMIGDITMPGPQVPPLGFGYI